MTASDPARADINVVVVGAGAAGIAAARHLTARGFAVTVLDARDRVGGRAWTALLDGRHPADLGCGWLHSADRNPWTGIALRLGLEVDRKLPDRGFRLAKARQLGAIEADARERAFAAFWRAIEEPVGPDRALADALPASDSWLPSFAAVTSFIFGVGSVALSVADLARYADTGVNWRVVVGYGRLVERHAAGLPVTLAAPAEAVDWSSRAVAVTTPKGTLRCRAAVLTLPVSLLAREAIRFTPALPQAKLAAAGLPMGHIAKLLLAVEGCPFDVEPDTQAVGSLRSARTTIYHLEPLGRPLVEAYWSGSLALELEQAGLPAMVDFALGELAGLFGSGVRRRLRPLLVSTGPPTPTRAAPTPTPARGGADGRAVLAEPLEGRLFFAGEACSADAYSTAHGAYHTGVAAAEAVGRALRH